MRPHSADQTTKNVAEKPKNRVYFTDQMVLIGCGIAAVYWLLDSIVAIFMATDGPILHRVLGADMRDIWTRLIVLCLFVIFGSHAQFTINERREVAKKLEKDRLTRERFQRLLSPDLAEMVVSGQLTVEKGGVSRVATVMFVDIRGFTAMSERTPPGEVLQMLNEYFEVVVSVVFRYEGTVDKFMGDEIMVIWGAPIAHGDDPARAVRAALAVRDELEAFNRSRRAANKPPIQIGIGINTGTLVAGYIGSSQTMSYSVIGDTVNTASRLCSAAREGQIIISENSRNCIANGFDLVEIEAVRAKGKFHPIRAFTVVKERAAPLAATPGRSAGAADPPPFSVAVPVSKSI
ncbi:MAG: adenylate/guanylate cyclase domain-containing protein [Desulfobacterales bacterium]